MTTTTTYYNRQQTVKTATGTHEIKTKEQNEDTILTTDLFSNEYQSLTKSILWPMIYMYIKRERGDESLTKISDQ